MILQEFLVFILLSSNLVRINVEAIFGTSSYQYYDMCHCPLCCNRSKITKILALVAMFAIVLHKISFVC